MSDQLLLNVIKQIETIPYGSVSFTVYRHDNKTVSVTINEYENALFSDNVEFMEWLVAGMKTIQEKKQTGNVSFSLQVKEGKFKKVTEVRQKQINGV